MAQQRGCVESHSVLGSRVFVTAIIDAHESRDVISGNDPNAFIQTTIPNADKAEEQIIMKITGVLVNYLVDIAPELYGPYVVFEDGKKVLCLASFASHFMGLLITALLWFNRLKKDLGERR